MTRSDGLELSPVLGSLIETCADTNRELWIAYRTTSKDRCTARLALRDANETFWVGGAFSIPSDRFLFIGATRDRTTNAVRLDRCGYDELCPFFDAVTIPFSLGWSLERSDGRED